MGITNFDVTTYYYLLTMQKCADQFRLNLLPSFCVNITTKLTTPISPNLWPVCFLSTSESAIGDIISHELTAMATQACDGHARLLILSNAPLPVYMQDLQHNINVPLL